MEYACKNRAIVPLWEGATVSCFFSMDDELDHTPCGDCRHYKVLYHGDEWAMRRKGAPGHVHFTKKPCPQCEGRERLVANGQEEWCPRCDI